MKLNITVMLIAGSLGQGKSATALHFALQENKPIISNLYLKNIQVPYEYMSELSFFDWLTNLMKLKDNRLMEEEVRKKFAGKVWLQDEAEGILSGRSFAANENVLQIIRAIGKINGMFIGTLHVFSSDMDKVVRNLTNFAGYSYKYDIYGNHIISEPRKVNEKRIFVLEGEYYVNKDIIPIKQAYDLEYLYDKYETEQMLLFNRKQVKI